MTSKYYPTFKEILVPIVLKLLLKPEEKETLPNDFYKTSKILIPKPKTLK